MNSTAKQIARRFLSNLFQSIKHGDQEHQNWLENKIDDMEEELEKEILLAIKDYNEYHP